MTPKREFVTLREMHRLFENCDERVAKYSKLRWTLMIVSWVLIFFAVLLLMTEALPRGLCLVITWLAGFTGGLSLLYSVSAMQTPLIVRYTTLNREAIEKRMAELNDSPQKAP